MARAQWLHGNGGGPCTERRHQLPTHPVENDAHVFNGIHAKEGHRSVGYAPASGDFKPVDTAMADVDAISVGGLGDDDGVGPIRTDAALLRQIRHAGKATTLFIDSTADFHRAHQRNSRATNCFSGVNRRGDPSLHVARATPVDAPVLHDAAKGIHRPSRPSRNNIEVAIEMHQRPIRAAAPQPDDIHARMRSRVLRTCVRHGIVDRKIAFA